MRRLLLPRRALVSTLPARDLAAGGCRATAWSCRLAAWRNCLTARLLTSPWRSMRSAVLRTTSSQARCSRSLRRSSHFFSGSDRFTGPIRAPDPVLVTSCSCSSCCSSRCLSAWVCSRSMTCTTDRATREARCCSRAVLSCTRASFGAMASNGASDPGWTFGLISQGRLEAAATERHSSSTTRVCSRVQRSRRPPGPSSRTQFRQRLLSRGTRTKKDPVAN